MSGTTDEEHFKHELFEINTSTGEIRSNIFYCDAMQSSQKPHVENNHNYIYYENPRIAFY